MAPRWVNRLLDSGPLLARAVRFSGMTSPQELGEMTLSMLQGLEGFQADEIHRLADWIRDVLQPDVVIMSNGLLAGVGAGLKQRTGAKVLCTLQSELHFVEGLDEPHREQAWALIGQALAQLDGVVAVSEYCRDETAMRAGIPAESIRVIPSGLALGGFKARAVDDEAPPVLGYFARLSEEKGAMRLVDAFDALRSRPGLARLSLDMGGSVVPGNEGYLRELAFRSKLRARVRIAPNVTLEQRLNSCRESLSFACRAEHEVAGLYALEAMASGVPVVAAHVGGAGELVNATGGGLLYRAGDTDGMLDTLERILKNPDLQRKLGAAGREAVLRDYTADAMAQRWSDALQA